MQIRNRILTLVAIMMALVLSSIGSALASSVLPPSAHPHGWSLDRMTAALAQFSTSGNNPAYAPATPFQILATAPGTGTLIRLTAALRQSTLTVF